MKRDTTTIYPEIRPKIRPKKQRKSPAQIITRTFYDDRLHGHDKPRLTVICYRYHRLTGQLFYGASLFRQDRDNEVDIVFGSKKNLKAALRQTAQSRLEKRPVCIDMDDYPAKIMHKHIRKAIYKYGVVGSSEKNTLQHFQCED